MGKIRWIIVVGLLGVASAGGFVSRQDAEKKIPGEAFRDFSEDGAWCWFADPRAVFHEGKIYGGWVDSQGSIWVAAVDPSIVYLSRQINGIFEIERWTTPDGGGTWRSQAVTSGSSHNNVRPFVLRNHPANEPLVLWMNLVKYIHYTDFMAIIKINRLRRGIMIE